MDDEETKTARHNKISVTGGSAKPDSDLLSRCLVGNFQFPPIKTPTLNDVRKWAGNTWKSTFGVNVFSMNDSQFLFELPSRKDAEHVMSRDWSWQKKKLQLQWWNPTIGCWPEEINRDWVWIRLLGIPLNLWSQKIFEEIGNCCGSFLETEEETTLRNHLHWARIKVKGDGKAIPREIEVENEGLTYNISVRVEIPVTVKAEGRRNEETLKYPLDNSTIPAFFDRDVRAEISVNLSGHVGTSIDGGKVVSEARGGSTYREGIKNPSGLLNQQQNLGPKLSPTKLDPVTLRIPIIFEKEAQLKDSATIEIQVNTNRERRIESHIQSTAMIPASNNPVTSEGEERPAELQEDQLLVADNVLTGADSTEIDTMQISTNEKERINSIEAATPVKIQVPADFDEGEFRQVLEQNDTQTDEDAMSIIQVDDLPLLEVQAEESLQVEDKKKKRGLS